MDDLPRHKFRLVEEYEKMKHGTAKKEPKEGESDDDEEESSRAGHGARKQWVGQQVYASWPGVKKWYPASIVKQHWVKGVQNGLRVSVSYD